MMHLCLWLLMCGCGAAGLDIYVAPPSSGSGDGSQATSVESSVVADGTESRPFRSVHAARDAMRAGLGQGEARTVQIEGVHFLEHPLVLDSRDAGTRDAPVTWQSRSKDAPAQLTGGKQVPTAAFAPASVPSGAQGVMKANLFTALGLTSADLGGMSNPYPFADMELYVDGQPMTRARSPNIVQDGTSHGHWMWAGYSNVTGVTDMSFDFADTTMAELWAPAAKSDTGLWLHGFFKFDWRDTFIKIDSIVPNDNHSYTVTRSPLTPPQYPFTNGCRFYAVAALELLDVPGEYHINNKTGDLHYLPLKPMSSETKVVVSVLNTVVEAGADHHSFKDMTISVARAGPAFTTVTNGTSVGTHVTVENCTVSNSGGGCLALQGSFNSAKDNSVFGCGSSGISVNAGDINALTPGNASVIGNNMSQVARIQRTYAPGVAFSGVGNYVANNTVSDVPHTAITGGGNDWLFEYNTITHACYETIDTGAFYIGRSWSQRGNVARYNVFDTVRPTETLAQKSCSQNAFYLDDQMSGWEFYGNLIKNATTGVLLGGGRRNKIYDNTFVSCDLDIEFDNRGMNWQLATCNSTNGSLFQNLEKLHYKQPPYSTRYPELLTIETDHPCVPVHNEITSNVYCHKHSMNLTGVAHEFINAAPATIKSWFSTMSDNKQHCNDD